LGGLTELGQKDELKVSTLAVAVQTEQRIKEEVGGGQLVDYIRDSNSMYVLEI